MRVPVRGLRAAAALAWGLSSVASVHAAGDEAVQDAQARWHFRHVDSAYIVGGRALVCVQKADGRWDFWDPKRDVLLGMRNLDCLPPVGSRTQDLAVYSAPVPGTTLAYASEASFDGASAIWAQSLDDGHCQFAFDRFFTALFARGEAYSFYLIERLRRPRPVDLTLTACATVAGVVSERYAQSYDAVRALRSLDLGDHRTLLMGTADGGEPIALVLHGRPRDAWCNAQGLLLVPAPVIEPRLRQAGLDYPPRERVVEQLMATAR